MSTPELIAALSVLSAALSIALTGQVRALAVRRGLMDNPNDRSSHTAPTPRGGGIAIIAASAIGMTTAALTGLSQARDAFTLIAGIVAIGAVGWLDDARGVKPRLRLAVHLAVAAATVAALGGMPALSLGIADVPLGLFGYALAAIGIVWSINLFNFMDGIDGLGGSQAVLIFGAGAVLLFLDGDVSLGALALLLAAASAGFLVWNWPPAKIFLGDVGSGAIGYAVATIAVISENHHSIPILGFAILGGVFILDATVTLVRRLLRGYGPAQAHRDHAYQRLARLWGNHRRVTVAAACVTALLAVLGAVGSLWPRLLLPAFVLACVVLTSLFMAAEQRVPM